MSGIAEPRQIRPRMCLCLSGGVSINHFDQFYRTHPGSRDSTSHRTNKSSI